MRWWLQISIHAPRTGSDDNPPDDDLLAEVISIHAPRTGSDTDGTAHRGEGRISIHAPRTGSDALSKRGFYPFNDFNPRSPHGERQNQPIVYVHY